ncbi:MAG: hypothetical protein ABFS35_17790 [Bacteroidota bacterium]
MSLIQPYIDSLEQLKADIPKIAENIVKQNADEIIRIIQRKQLGIGLNSFGNPLSWEKGTGFYSPYTQDYADRDNIITPKPAGQPYNFSWSQDTFRTMVLEVRQEGAFEIFTKDGKQNLLESIYGEIFDLTPEHNEYVNQVIILPSLYRYLLDNLFKI